MDYLQVNQQAWDKRTEIHKASRFYDVDGFLQGASSLQEIECRELAVAGKSLLHLQCHFGLDTLSWARLGAKVTGVDLSPAAIGYAQELAQKAKLDATFVASDVYQCRQYIQTQFDLVYTSYGALCWLPDLRQWAEVVAASLKPGGEFYMVEFHPLQAVFEGYRYFSHAEPDIETEVTYTENANDEKHTTATWSHPISEVINALIQAGLNIQSVQEYDYSPYNCFEGLVEVAEGRYAWLHQEQAIPLTYALRAKKPE